MKWFLVGIVFFGTIQAATAIAEESFLCKSYYEKVQRKETLIKSYGTDLSSMAKEKLFKDLKFETSGCISNCGGDSSIAMKLQNKFQSKSVIL